MSWFCTLCKNAIVITITLASESDILWYPQSTFADVCVTGEYLQISLKFLWGCQMLMIFDLYLKW